MVQKIAFSSIPTTFPKRARRQETAQKKPQTESTQEIPATHTGTHQACYHNPIIILKSQTTMEQSTSKTATKNTVQPLNCQKETTRKKHDGPAKLTVNPLTIMKADQKNPPRHTPIAPQLRS